MNYIYEATKWYVKHEQSSRLHERIQLKHSENNHTIFWLFVHSF